MRERPTLRTERLLLRPFRDADAPEAARLAGDREIAATTLLIPHPYVLEDAERWLAGHQEAFEAGRAVDWAVCLRDGTLVGAIALRIDPAHDAADLGYWIGRAWWGRGYATEAAAAVIRYGFEVLRLNRVHAHHFARNPASGRVMEKVGMRREGVLRQHVKKWGNYEDCVMYGLLRSEWGAGGGGVR